MQADDSALDELARLVRWTGGGVGDVNWEEAERQVGFTIPTSFKKYAARFPAGEFQTYLFVNQLLSPTHLRLYAARVRSDLRYLRVVSRYSPEFRYHVFPTLPGLVPWGTIEGDYIFCWCLTGEEEHSPTIVIIDRDDGTAETFDGSMTECILAILHGDIPALRYVTEECDPPRFDVHEFNLPEEEQPHGAATDYRDLDPSGLLTVPSEQTDALADLRDLVVAGTPQAVEWAALDQHLRHALPSDYKRLIETLGPGTYGDIIVASPSGPTGEVPGLIDVTAAALDSLNQNVETPIPVGPIAWGMAPNGWFCGWVPGEYPTDQRPVMLFHRWHGAGGRSCSTTSFLARHLRDPRDWYRTPWRIGEPD